MLPLLPLLQTFFSATDKLTVSEFKEEQALSCPLTFVSPLTFFTFILLVCVISNSTQLVKTCFSLVTFST